MEKYIWYVCYGSNLLLERFMCYLTGKGLEAYHLAPDNKPCSNQSSPKDIKVVEIPHNIYFALTSQTWNGAGVCFLNDKGSGRCVGRAYLITEEQFNFVKAKEGSKYTKTVKLEDIDGYEAYTFTHSTYVHPGNLPHPIYMKVIRDGLVQCGFEKIQATRYIKKYIRIQGLQTPIKRDGGSKTWNELTLEQKRHRLYAALVSGTVGFWIFCGKETQRYYERVPMTEENIDSVKEEILDVYRNALIRSGIKNIDYRMKHIHKRID